MEEHLNPLAVSHLLQQTLRSLCIHENSQWIYAVFWRILPRNYPPPIWDGQAARGNRRNWILVWEDGFCNFAASSSSEMEVGEFPISSVYGNNEFQQYPGLQPELFFKMSHEIYNYGEGLIGKVAADHSHRWIFKEPHDQDLNFLSAWHNSSDSHPRTWEAQFESGVKVLRVMKGLQFPKTRFSDLLLFDSLSFLQTIALIAVREGVIQLGAVQKVVEDLSYVVLLRNKFSYIQSIPGVLLPHPSSTSFPFTAEDHGGANPEVRQFQATLPSPSDQFHTNFNDQLRVTPSMTSLEALLAKLPSVVPPPTQPPHPRRISNHRPFKEEVDEEANMPSGESNDSMLAYHYQQLLHNHYEKTMDF